MANASSGHGRVPLNRDGKKSVDEMVEVPPRPHTLNDESTQEA